MKFLFAFLLSLAIGKKCFATEWLTYYVYIQTEYEQGPWSRIDLLDQSGKYVYLNPKEAEGLFGSERIQFANAVLALLKKTTPERYKFKCELSTLEDTVIIAVKDTITDFDAVKNELVASFTLNNYSTVKIIQKGKAQSFQLKDISVPYMDLVYHPAILPKVELAKDSIVPDSLAVSKTTTTNVQAKKNLLIWLDISVILNLILIIFFIRGRK